MITVNYWLDHGLVNGALGVIKYIIFDEGSAPPHLPLAVVVTMEASYRGPHLSSGDR